MDKRNTSRLLTIERKAVSSSLSKERRSVCSKRLGAHLDNCTKPPDGSGDFSKHKRTKTPTKQKSRNGQKERKGSDFGDALSELRQIASGDGEHSVCE